MSAYLALALLSQEEPASNPALGFPVMLLVLAVLATVFALVWRTISKRRSDE